MKIISTDTIGEVKTLLEGAIGQVVQLESHAHAESIAGRIGFMVSGVLEYCEDDDSWFVRIKEDYTGTSGVAFWPQHVQCGERLYPNTLRIRLK